MARQATTALMVASVSRHNADADHSAPFARDLADAYVLCYCPRVPPPRLDLEVEASCEHGDAGCLSRCAGLVLFGSRRAQREPTGAGMTSRTTR